MKKDKALPKVAPMKNSGVTSPPLNPAAKVSIVSAIFIAKSYNGSCSSNDCKMVGIPKPIYFVVPKAKTAKATNIPPTNGRSGGNFILVLNIFFDVLFNFYDKNFNKERELFKPTFEIVEKLMDAQTQSIALMEKMMTLSEKQLNLSSEIVEKIKEEKNNS